MLLHDRSRVSLDSIQYLVLDEADRNYRAIYKEDNKKRNGLTISQGCWRKASNRKSGF